MQSRSKSLRLFCLNFSRGGSNRKKGFAGISGHELIEYLMVWYRNIAKPINGQEKSEFREDYNPILPISKSFKRVEDTVQLADNAIFSWQPEKSFSRAKDK